MPISPKYKTQLRLTGMSLILQQKLNYRITSIPTLKYFCAAKSLSEQIKKIFSTTILLTGCTHLYPRASCYSLCLLLLPNEQLHWNKWSISALLNCTIIVIAQGGKVIHSPSPSRFPADLWLSHHVPIPPPLDNHHLHEMASMLLYWAINP